MKKTVFSLLSAVALLSIMLLVTIPARAQLTVAQGPYTPISITGLVTCFRKAFCGIPGSITIGGVTIPIAAGTDVGFFDSTTGILGSGLLGPVTTRSEHFQIVGGPGECGPGTIRTLTGYLNAQGEFVLQLGGAGARLPLPATTPLTFDVTGAFTVGAGTLTVGGLTFRLGAGVTVPAFAPGTTVRLTGVFNPATGLLFGPTATPGTLQLRPAFTNVARFCDAALNLISVSPGVGLPSDVNPGDPAGPIFGGIGATNPIGQTFSAYARCAQSVDLISFERLLAGIPSAPAGSFAPSAAFFVNPGFNLRPLVWTFKPACFVFQVDQFNWIVGATVTPNP